MSRDEIREIALIAGDDGSYSHFVKRINKEFDAADQERNANVYVLYVERGEKKIGFCVIGYSPSKMKAWERIFREEDWVTGKFSIDTAMAFELMYIYVRPEYRRMGYGDRLFEKAMDFTRKKGAREIYAYVGDKDDSALKFYRKQNAMIIRDFSDEDGSAAFLMWKV